MLRLFFRQRRRLLFAATFGTIGLMMMAVRATGGAAYYPNDSWIFLISFAIVGLIVAAGIALVSALLIVVLPNWRIMIELLSLMVFFNAILMATVPWLFDLPYVGGFVPFIVYMGIFSVTYSEFSDRFRFLVDHRETSKFTSPKSAEELWTELVPDPGNVADHWDILLRELEPDEEEPECLHAKYTHGGSLYELQTMTYLEKTAPHHAKYHHIGEVDPKNRSLVEGTYEIEISPRKDGKGCVVTLTSRRNAMLLRVALHQWFDDSLGDKADHLRARHLGRWDWTMTNRYRQRVAKFA